MGIKDLMKVIKEHAPGAIETYKLEVFSGYTIAIDVSIYLNKFIKSNGIGIENSEVIDSAWIERFLLMLCKLKKNGIKTVCVFDGPNAPKEKIKEQEKRRSEAQNKNKKIEDAKYLLKKVVKDYLPYDSALDSNIKEQIKNVVGKRLRNDAQDISNYDDLDEVIIGLKTAISRYEKQNAPIVPEYGKIIQELVAALGFNYFVAPGEAEGLCVWLTKKGMCDGVLSEDTDVLAYGCPLMLCKMDTFNNTVCVVNYKQVLSEMNFTKEQFTDMCILLRCDYNKHVCIKGYPYGKVDAKGKPRKPVAIGTKKVVPLIKEYGTFEYFEDLIDNIDDLIYHRCREIFSLTDEPEFINVGYDKPLNEKKIKKFIEKYKVRTGYELIKLAWSPPNIIFPK